MVYSPHDYRTPWQKVAAKFNMSPSELARTLGRHRSKLSRALRDSKGLINGKDQELILQVAARKGVNVTPDDLTPDRH